MTTLTFKQIKEVEKLKHDYRMEELRYQRENNSIMHDSFMSQLRLKNANDNRLVDKKDYLRDQQRKKYLEERERREKGGFR